tara:strand:- start:277 stop:555 length:279 start_codon:yes stop_codon:yes gene_type:complete
MPLAQLLKLAKSLRPELSKSEIRKLLEISKQEGRAMRYGDYGKKTKALMKQKEPLRDKLHMGGFGSADPVARRNYMDVESNLEDLIDLFARG